MGCSNKLHKIPSFVLVTIRKSLHIKRKNRDIDISTKGSFPGYSLPRAVVGPEIMNLNVT